MKIESSRWADRARTASAALLLPFLLGFVVPANVAVRNLDEIGFAPGSLVFFALVFALLAAIALPAFAFAERSRWARWGAKTSIGFAIVILLWDVLSVPALAFHLSRWIWGLLELAVVAVVIWPLWRLPMDWIVRIAAAMTPVIVLVSVADLWNGLDAGPRVYPEQAASTTPGDSEPAREIRGRAAPAGNVYHFMFDQYQREAFEYVLERDVPLRRLPLTYYPRFRTNTFATFVSNAILLSGTLYDGRKPPGQWIRDSYFSNLFDWLGKRGIGLHQYPFNEYYCRSFAVVCLPAARLAMQSVSSTAILADLWFQRLMPRHKLEHPLGSDTWDYGLSITSFFTGVSPQKVLREYSRFSVRQFEQLIQDEAARPASGQYVFAHVMLPHGPLVTAPDCGRRPLNQKAEDDLGALGADRYLEQVRCANSLAERFLAELERLGRLDSALVIAHSDHGRYYELRPDNPLTAYSSVAPREDSVAEFDHWTAESGAWASGNVELRSSALLWIKWPGQKEAARSPFPVQTIDIAPTILRHFGVKRRGLPGESIQTLPPDWTREQVFLTYKNGKRADFAARPGGLVPNRFARYRLRGGEWSLDGPFGARGRAARKQ